MVYRFIITILFISFTSFLNAQTGIGTTTPNASAKLDVSATNKGFLPPRISLTDIYDQTTIPTPATGLLVYCKGDAGLAAGYYYWNGNAWATIATSGGSGSFASSFMRGSKTGTQTIAVGGVVTFSSIDNSAGNDISLNTSTGKITLAAGNTYRIRGAVPNFSGGQRPAFIWYNETTSSNIGSATFAYNPGDAASLGAFGSTAELLITPNVSTVISFRLLSSLGSGSVTVGGNGDFSSTGSYPWFDIQVISGNAPITGQSVDYGIVKYTGNETGALTIGSIVQFDANASGNLNWNANKFTLKANKTYELESYLSIYQSAGGVAGVFQIYDYTNSAPLANGFYMSINGSGSYNPSANGPMRAIVTPTSDITVGIKFISYYGPGSPGLIGSTNYVGANAAANQCYFIVKQIGSSAIINPWVLSGNDVYNTSGEVGIGNTTPNAKLDVRTNTTSTTDPGDGTIGLGTSSTTAAASGKGALRFNNSTNKVEVSTGSAWQGASSPIFAQFLANASQSSISTGTKINFQTTVINVGGITIASNNTITLPAGRIYRIDFNAGWVSMGGGWARFAIYNNGTIASIPAHLEAVSGGSAINSSGATTTFINTSSGSTTIDVRYLAPSGSTVSVGDSGNGTSYPYIVIQAVD